MIKGFEILKLFKNSFKRYGFIEGMEDKTYALTKNSPTSVLYIFIII